MFILLVFVLLFSTSAALADQEGNHVWCNVDEYGCWVHDTDDPNVTYYIMFWSEETRDYFMGKDSNATVTPRPKGVELKLHGPHFWDYYDCSEWSINPVSGAKTCILWHLK